MTSKVITISRQFGSGGRTIGKEVAERLGIPYYDKELVDRVAKESGFSHEFIEEIGEYASVTSSFLFNIAVSSVGNGLDRSATFWDGCRFPCRGGEPPGVARRDSAACPSLRGPILSARAERIGRKARQREGL
jgi:hypothetical protein